MANGIEPLEKDNKPEVEDIFELNKKETSPKPEAKEARPEITKEAAPEARPEMKPAMDTEEEDARRRYAPPPAAAKPAAPTIKSEEQIAIENILSDHLGDIFLQLPPEQQLIFQKAGEVTAGKIEKLLQDVKIKVKEVISLIRDWLRLIPGVNIFFLEQEAKIKADRILSLHDQKHKQK